MKDYFRVVSETWQGLWENAAFRVEFWLSLFALVFALMVNVTALIHFQQRSGMLLNDRILHLFSPRDFSLVIFLLIYSCIIIALFHLLQEPKKLAQGLQMFALMLFARTASIWLVPLEPPHDMVVLSDPIATFVLRTPNTSITKDLFFSGHTAAIMLLFLLMPFGKLKWLTGLVTALVPLLILWQHVHYSIDVAGGYIAAIACYKAVQMLHAKISGSSSWQWQ